jgi:hypothetical protein
VVEFNQLSQLLAPLSPDIAASQAALGRLVANGGTGMAAGLQAAMNTLGPSPSLDPIIILLSDGLPNLSLSGSNFLAPDQVKQEVLDLASQAGQNGQCIYTVGFGVPLGAGQQASIDEAFLRQVAVNSGCGAYYNAQNALELANIYVLLRHASSGGEVLLEEAGQIAQNEQLDIATIDVPDKQSLVLYTLNWPGSRLEPLLRDPAGVTVDANYPGASISVGATVASVVLSNPQPGQWQVGALGVDVPGGQTTYHAVVSSRGGGPLAAPPPTSAGFPLAVFTIVAGGGAVGLYVLWQSNRRRRGLPVGPAPMGAAAPANARLIAATGPLAGQAILVTGGMFTLGRSRSSSLSVPDTLVSRRHAVIRYAQGRWYLQDQGSAAGTFVNGQRIVATVLNNGDRLRLGSVEFVFVVV